jgi:hypothetical protein
MSGERDVVNGTNGQGSEGTEVDEGSGETDGGENGINRARCLHHGSDAKSTIEESGYL